MNFFKNLFSRKKEEKQERNDHKTSFEQILSEEHFKERYKEENIDKSILEGALKLVESYFVDNKIEKKVKLPINHPINLDQTVNDGFGFSLYCKAFNLDENQVLMILAMSFNDFMIQKYGFKLYRDSQPESPLRVMALKYEKEATILSIYPVEYASKVLNYQSNFENLYNQIDKALKNLPSSEEFITTLKE